MSANANAIFSGVGQDLVTGTVLSGAYGTTLPPLDNTFFEATLNSGFKDSGFISDAGVTISQGRSFTDIKDMDGNAIDTIQTESNGMIKTEFLELNEWTLKNLFGADNVTVGTTTLTTGTRYAVAVALGEDQDPMSHVLRMKSGNKRAGVIIPRGRFTDIGDISFSSSGAAKIPVTIKTIPTYVASFSKNIDFFLCIDDGVFAVSLIPVITSITPSAVTTGNTVSIFGSKFTGTTGITFGGTAVGAGKFTVVNDGTIVALMPTGSAGSAACIVTNASGPSDSFGYTRG